MPADPSRLCACHGETMYRMRKHGKVAWFCYHYIRERWKTSNDHQRQTLRGRRSHAASTKAANERKVMFGRDYVGLAATPDQAQALRAEIRAKVAAFDHYQQEDRCRFREQACKSGW